MKLYETLDAIVELYNNIYLTQTEYCNELVYVPAVVRTLLNFFYSNGSSCIPIGSLTFGREGRNYT